MSLLDASREDPFLVDGNRRELLVRFWYPASAKHGCTPAEYTSDRSWKYFSQLLGTTLPQVTTNSCQDAPITPGVHPVVVFTHGYTGTFTDYTFIFEDLASRGYVVASVDHTYEATAVDFPDGRFAESRLGSHLGKSIRNDDPAQALALSVRLNDLKFVFDELSRMHSNPQSPFAGALDMSRVALAGHSFGGLTAVMGVQRDKRYKAAVVIDNVPPLGLVSPTKTPTLLLAAGRKSWSDEERDLWNHLRGPRLAVNFEAADHLAPSDAIWIVPEIVRAGSMGADKTISGVRDYIAAFLDVYLRGRGENPLLLHKTAQYPGITIVSRDHALPAQP